MNLRLAYPPSPINALPNSRMDDGSGISPPGVPTSLPSLPPSGGTFWNLTKIALQISASVNPANAAPETVNDALSPGVSPRFGEPPEKLSPVTNPKSSTAVLNPCGTLPKSPSEKVKLEDRLGACIPVKPFNPEALAFPSGGKSKPMPVIVEVDPGWVICEVFVIVKVKVLVWELNSQTTVAVENWPESTPTTVIVSAFTVLAPARTKSAAREKINLRNRDMEILLESCSKVTPALNRSALSPVARNNCEKCGAVQVSPVACVCPR